MLIERRSVLNMLMLTPAYLYAARVMGISPTLDIQDGIPGGADVNLVFHGFFFFDFQTDALVVSSPSYQDHNFLFRDEDVDDLNDMPQEALNYTTQLKWGPATPAWPDAILHFNKSEAKLDVPLIPRTFDAKKHGSLLILPYPERVVAIRYGGTTDELTLGGNIAQYIKRPSDKILGLITCLQYFKKANLDFDTRHYYAEHCIPPGNTGVASALKAARDAFGGDFNKGFDLTVTQTELSKAQKAVYRRRLKAIPEDDYNDEAALLELRNVGHNPCKPFPARLPTSSLDKKAPSMHKPPKHPELIRTANCPQFGMVSSASMARGGLRNSR